MLIAGAALPDPFFLLLSAVVLPIQALLPQLQSVLATGVALSGPLCPASYKLLNCLSRCGGASADYSQCWWQEWRSQAAASMS